MVTFPAPRLESWAWDSFQSMNPVKTALLFLLLLTFPALADGPSDNIPDNVRRQPPPGVPIPDDVRAELTAAAAQLKQSIDGVAAAREQFPHRYHYLPDVEVFWKAVDWALRYDEFFDSKQTEWARDQLKEGRERLDALTNNRMPWLRAGSVPHAFAAGFVPPPHLIVRGYRSKIDDSVQPFGLVLPPSFNPDLPHRWRLDCWFHGRGEKLTELDFIHQRRNNHGEFTPQDTIVLHPYGRYCNGHRFTGETDFFEALETVKRDYRIDEDRIVVRGFSLGGAACWHIATHHAWQWCAANPGAGFSETEQFLNFFQGEKLKPYPWERKLWNLYDATAVAGNLFNCPTVAYSGENDKQKQAADRMAEALKKEGLELTHIIGPKTGHSYEKGAKAEVARRIDAISTVDRDYFAQRLTTYSLRYHKLAFGSVDGLAEHWREANVELIVSSFGFINVESENVTAMTVNVPSGRLVHIPGSRIRPGVIPAGLHLTFKQFGGEPQTPGQTFDFAQRSDGSVSARFYREGDKWVEGSFPDDGLRKKHGLQGPIDDAFMDSFIFVRPTGTAANEKAGAWAKAEMERAIEHWRRHFRGDARVKDDTALTEADIQSANLVLWGDPSSNALMAKVAPKLPILWTATEIKAGAKTFPAADHALICIYPNPLNPERYLVLNSSFTFREYDYLNNARQTPKLPDWAIIDLKTPPNSRYPGAIPAADFFGEKWELK
jgi:Prolyl oligopeptidase family